VVFLLGSGEILGVVEEGRKRCPPRQRHLKKVKNLDRRVTPGCHHAEEMKEP